MNSKLFLSKLGNGYYYIWYMKPDGKMTKKSTRTKRKDEAMAVFADWCSSSNSTFFCGLEAQTQLASGTDNISGQSELAISKIDNDFPNVITLNKFISILNAHYDNCIPVKPHLKCFPRLLKYLGNKPLVSITSEDIQNYINNKIRTDKKNLPWGARHDYAGLSVAFNWAVSKGLIEKNPCKGVKKPKAPELVPTYLSKDEYRILMDCIESDIEKLKLSDDKRFTITPYKRTVLLKNIVQFAVLTGMRLGEIWNLEWEHVDLLTRIVHVRNTETFKTKSRKNRSIPMAVEGRKHSPPRAISIPQSEGQKYSSPRGRKDSPGWTKSIPHLLPFYSFLPSCSQSFYLDFWRTPWRIEREASWTRGKLFVVGTTTNPSPGSRRFWALTEKRSEDTSVSRRNKGSREIRRYPH